MNEPLLYKLIGSRIRSARESARPKVSQEKLSKLVRLTRASVVNIEAGRQRTPVHVIYQIAEAVGVQPEDLIPGPQELKDAEQPIHLDQEAVAKIEEAANGDPETHFFLTQFVSRAKAQSKPKP